MTPAFLNNIPVKNRKLRILFIFSLVFTISLAPLVNGFIQKANAAGLTSAKVQIGDSRAGVDTVHRFQFVTPTTTNIKTILFQYCTTPSGTCTAPSGMELTSTITLGGVAGIGGTSYSAAGSDSTCNGTGNTDCTITLTVGTPGAQGAGATVIVPFTVGITNPTTVNTTYYTRVTTRDVTPATIDGPTSVAFGILDTNSISVTATVDPNFTFTVSRAVTGNTGSGSSPDLINVSTTTNSTIPYGTLNTSVASVSAHDITVTTNAGSGYVVTASSSAVPPLTASSNNIDSFTGTNAAPADFNTSPNGTTANSDTGFFGYTTNDATLCTGTAARFTDGAISQYAGFTAHGEEVACSTAGVSSETTRVSWKLWVNPIQPAGSYSGTVILVATPTY